MFSAICSLTVSAVRAAVIEMDCEMRMDNSKSGRASGTNVSYKLDTDNSTLLMRWYDPNKSGYDWRKHDMEKHTRPEGIVAYTHIGMRPGGITETISVLPEVRTVIHSYAHPRNHYAGMRGTCK
jgi:hypothetical protein